ncbi:hypothetical protein [Limoniibacter endophyticus]|uniref:Uncharacterized protein n=1 Tax=Limoniibacter endophyticus TaxID=1565040 RepID=A0A8J3DGZ4_9HYPH|nr:hypothetical protein [Limoniibacter endophyticus]GHC66697.1 hypothetical protein GCM10010136_09990 [Limoniibacter endophyticus]
MEAKERAVFDWSDSPHEFLDHMAEWTPPRRTQLAGVAIRLPEEGPTIEWRLSAQAARITSNKFSGQHANDNQEWPLAKLLRTEGNAHCMQLAERFRALWDTAHQPVQLIGTAADNLYVVHNQDGEGRSKGVKRLRGKKAQIDTPAKQRVRTNDETKKRAAPIAKKWNGDAPLIAAIDAKVELGMIRAKLAVTSQIIDAFESLVVEGKTLEETGLSLGFGTKGAKGAARALMMTGFEIVDRFWQARKRIAE